MTAPAKSEKQSNHFFIAMENLATGLFHISIEIFNAIRKNTLNWLYCSFWMIATNILYLSGADLFIFKHFGLLKVYLKFPFLFWFLYTFLCLFGFISWAIRERNNRNKMLKELTEVFVNSELKNPSGKIPNFITDQSIDQNNRKLTMTSENIPLKKFEEKQDELESGLKVYIDDIREIREKGIIDIYYSQIPMPTKIEVDDYSKQKNYGYLVGMTRSKTVNGSFKKSPHLLVAGQSNGGKSNFIKQAIVSLYLNNVNAKFTLVDLKEGLEFQVFKNLERIEVMEEFDSILSKLSTIDKEMTKRMKILKSHSCNDIDSYHKKMKEEDSKVKMLNRHFVFIDEAAEMFLATSGDKTKNVQDARKAMSRIARIGRACGVHLIIATQRPDVKAVDPQIKANLTSILCFKMPNLASSMTVLSNGRAAQLPSETPGRGIWKDGSKMLEVQSPYFCEKTISKLLAPFKTVDKPTPGSSEQNTNDQKPTETPSAPRISATEV